MAIPKNYRIPEAAPLIGYTKGTTQQYVSRGVIESVRIGRLRFIPEAVIEKICREGLDTSESGLKRTRKARNKK